MKSGATNTLWVEVMARQLASEWAVLERCPQEVKNGWGTKGVNPTLTDGIKGGIHEQ